MKRGEIYYVSRDYNESGTEERAGRPAVILSCDATNNNGYIVNVVFLTSSPRGDSPLHPRVNSAGRIAYAICEQVTTVSASRIGDFIGKCDVDEFADIEANVRTALGLDAVFTRPLEEEDYDETDDVLVASLTAERDTYKTCFEQIVNKLTR